MGERHGKNEILRIEFRYSHPSGDRTTSTSRDPSHPSVAQGVFLRIPSQVELSSMAQLSERWRGAPRWP